MKSRQDGREVPPYAAETARAIGNLGAGGHGNFEGRSDAVDRGVTPALMTETDIRATEHSQAQGGDEDCDIMEPASGEQHSPLSETERARQAKMDDTTQKIREKAYELWVLEGRPEGRDLAHWDMATELVAQQEELDTTLLPIEPDDDGVEDAVAALDNEGEVPGLTDQGKDDSNALRTSSPVAATLSATNSQMNAASPAKKKAGRPKI